VIRIIIQLIEEGVLPSDISLNYTVAEGFDKMHGKFANTMGNVAIVDCSSIAP